MYTFTLFNNEPTTRSVDAGEVIFAQGAPGNCMFAVIDGEVDIVRDGKVIETVPPGGVFGELGMLDHQPRTAAAIARRIGRLAEISDKRFTAIVSLNPPFALSMMRLLSQRIRSNLAS